MVVVRFEWVIDIYVDVFGLFFCELGEFDAEFF